MILYFDYTTKENKLQYLTCKSMSKLNLNSEFASKKHLSPDMGKQVLLLVIEIVLELIKNVRNTDN